MPELRLTPGWWSAVRRLGLGLAIAGELARRMDSALKVESRPGWTTFTLELPLVSAPFPRENEPVTVPRA